ncbi:alpha/beta-hydrolase [Zopfia rhizophila CBS 207.26]|uniref:Carboxylic ester hydrolase n=1 Tax=Zopfia rhizophila CBS 207.26 TaxID=1314779 RepID=A0A6A6DFL9_9PEZI|nr:alpha/beta-hydrolase [Zopfia rhizophila CBS 207.26]
MNSLLLITLLITTVFATPSVSTKEGLILGSTSNTVDTFLGIPYADPPIGNLRLRRPQPLSKPLGTFNATAIPRACPQKTLTGDLPILASFPAEVSTVYFSYNITLNVTGEDCLTLNIQRPTNITANANWRCSVTAKLPVLFWIYGGAFEGGATSRSDYTQLVAKSIELGEPIMVVAVNYRLGTFGFLGGKELKAEGNTNLGLRDQRLALEWVQENIEAFGGDPEKVTIWGQSAGATSVYSHLLINGGDNTSNRTGKPLFHAAIMNSGASFPAEVIDNPTAQSIYDRIVSAVGCAPSSASISSLECLRDTPYEKLVDATNALPYLYSPQGFHLNYVPRPDDSDSFFTASELEPGHCIADVPLIVGHQEDESTVFMAPTSDVSTSAALVSMLQAMFPSAPRPALNKFVSYYHGDADTGAPFHTNASQEAYPNSKINSAVMTDLPFVFQSRAFVSSITGSSPICRRKSPVWAFQAAYGRGFPLLGTFHGSDLVLMATGQPRVPYEDIVGRYVRFVRVGVPSLPAGKMEWPVYGKKRELLQFNIEGERIIIDNFREEAFQYFRTVRAKFRY